MRFTVMKSGFDFLGRFCLILRLGGGGFDLDDESLVKRAEHFRHVCVFGEDDPLVGRAELAKFCKLLAKKSPETQVTIMTSGQNQPFFLENVSYCVFLKNKKSKLSYGERIVSDVIKQHELSKFFFIVLDEDDLDDAMLLVSEHGIDRSCVTLCFYDEKTFVLAKSYAMIQAYNVLFLFDYNRNGENDEQDS